MPFHIACVSLWPGNCPFGHVSQREDEKTYEEGTTDIISLKHILLSWLDDFSTSHQYRTICILPPSAFYERCATSYSSTLARTVRTMLARRWSESDRSFRRKCSLNSRKTPTHVPCHSIVCDQRYRYLISDPIPCNVADSKDKSISAWGRPVPSYVSFSTWDCSCLTAICEDTAMKTS